jgi:hypothetical protein
LAEVANSLELCGITGLKLFTGTAGVPPAMSAEREPPQAELAVLMEKCPFSNVAGGTPALPGKSSSHALQGPKGMLSRRNVALPE